MKRRIIVIDDKYPDNKGDYFNLLYLVRLFILNN